MKRKKGRKTILRTIITARLIGIYQPCFYRRYNCTNSDIFFNASGAVYALIPYRWFIVSVYHFQSHIYFSVRWRIASIGRPSTQSVLVSLYQKWEPIITQINKNKFHNIALVRTRLYATFDTTLYKLIKFKTTNTLFFIRYIAQLESNHRVITYFINSSIFYA